ncbi:hypothetical protein EDC01DRAFT_494556 [Geopyxis carbonaria]|nr:hypothetical protein EDC01DRAFT_494556 [Geopyxis carbonaria]
MLSTILKFLALKRYQYEVTFSLYMLTPTEKFIFNTFLFFFLSMLILAVSLYLPHHVAIVASRAWFYYAGDECLMAAGEKAVSSSIGAAVAAATGHAEL